MKNEIIIRILDRSMAFLDMDQIKQLRGVIEDEMYHVKVEPECMALALTDNLPEMISLFLATKRLRGCSKKTIKNYGLILNKFSFAMRKDIEQITDMDIKRYLAAYSGTGVKNNTVSTTISCFKSFFTWLEAQDYIDKSPMRKVENIKVEKRCRKPLTHEELEMLRVACKTERELALVEFMYSPGCRLDEVYKLNKSDINWNAESCMVIGKGNKERRVFLNAKAKVHLWKYLSSRKDICEALFVTERGIIRRLGARSIEKIYSELGNRISKHVHPHIMRHTFATHMLQAGVPLSVVQELLGHEDPSTTQIYAKLDSSELQAYHRKAS